MRILTHTVKSLLQALAAWGGEPLGYAVHVLNVECDISPIHFFLMQVKRVSKDNPIASAGLEIDDDA